MRAGLPAFLSLAAALAACGPLPSPGPPPAEGAALPPGEYACVWVNRGANFQTALSFIVTAPGRYASTDNAQRGTFEIHGTEVRFRGGPFDGQTGLALHSGSFTVDGKRCAPATP